MKTEKELRKEYKDKVYDYILDYKNRQELMFGRKLRFEIKMRYDWRCNYVYFYDGDKYFMHYQITSFRDWCRIEGKV